MDPSAAAAAIRTFAFLSRSALTAAFSACALPVKRPSALTAFARLSAFSFFNPSRRIPQAFSAAACELGPAVLAPGCLVVGVAGPGEGAKAAVLATPTQLTTPPKTRFR